MLSAVALSDQSRPTALTPGRLTPVRRQLDADIVANIRKWSAKTMVASQLWWKSGERGFLIEHAMRQV